MTSRKHRSGSSVTPTPTTSAKWTGVRDPRATVRFSLDDRVTWDQGDGGVILATVVGFVDECTVQVRLENGRTVLWPTVSPRLRRVQTPDLDDMNVDMGGTLTGLEAMPLVHNPMEEAYYDAVSVAAEETVQDKQRRTIPDFVEYEATYPSNDDPNED